MAHITHINNYDPCQVDTNLKCACLTLLTLKSLNYVTYILTDLKLCLAASIHNFKWEKMTHIWLFWDQQLVNIDV